MFRRAAFLSLLGVVFTAASGLAQGTPPPSSPISAQAEAPLSSQRPVTTLKANAQLVVIDVVVTDHNRRPVHGLKAADFTLSEGRIAQTINHFEEHAALTPAESTQVAPMPKLRPGIFTNYTPMPASGAVNILLLDALNTPRTDQAYVRQQLLKYLASTPPGTRIAIFGLATHLILLQGFTSDPETLKNVMMTESGKSSSLLGDAAGGRSTQQGQADDLEDQGVDATIVANLRQFEAEQQSFQLQSRAKYTLDAMNDMARYLSGIPGRKNLIWFSGSFPISIMPDVTGSLKNPFAVMASAEDEFRDTVALLARSQVAVYPIDPRGPMTLPVFDAQNHRNYGGSQGIARMQQDDDRFFTDTAAEHNTLSAMAEGTGGHAFYNTNGLTQAVATAIDEGSNFYTLSYIPSNSEQDGKLRKIKVQVARRGLDLAYRQGYYADRPNGIKSAYAGHTSVAATPSGGIAVQVSDRMAMMRGAPTPAEILMKVGVVSMTTGTHTEDTVAPNNRPDAKTHGPYRRYSVNYAIDPTGITFLIAAAGKIHTDFDLIIFVFDRDSALVNSLRNRIQITGTMDELVKTISKGIYEHEEISAPAKGEFFLRIAVYDKRRDRYGVVEVATSEVRNAVPSQATNPALTP